MFGNLLKAVVAVAASPVALVVDIFTLPESSCSINKGAFDRTGALLKAAGDNVMKAVGGDKS